MCPDINYWNLLLFYNLFKAFNLAWDIIARFGSRADPLPKEFFTDLYAGCHVLSAAFDHVRYCSVKVAEDECRHFSIHGDV